MKIKQSFKKYGWDFELVKSEYLGVYPGSGLRAYKAIYVGRDPEVKTNNIEVVILKEKPAVDFWGQTEPTLSYPGGSKWGQLGWTFPNMEMANKKYIEITQISHSLSP